jgi:hypothetical protein
MSDQRAREAYEHHMQTQQKVINQAAIQSKSPLIRKALSYPGLIKDFDDLDEWLKNMWRYVAEGMSIGEARQRAILWRSENRK